MNTEEGVNPIPEGRWDLWVVFGVCQRAACEHSSIVGVTVKSSGGQRRVPPKQMPRVHAGAQALLKTEWL